MRKGLGPFLKSCSLVILLTRLEEWDSVADCKKSLQCLSLAKSYQMHISHTSPLCRCTLHPSCRYGVKHKRLSGLCLFNETKMKSCLEVQLDFILKHDLCFLG